VLVVTKCNFDSLSADRQDRLRSIAISVKLTPSIPTDKTPRVLAYAPKLVHGSLSPDQKKYLWETTSSVGFSRHDEKVQARASNITIVAEVQRSRDGAQHETVFWTAEESPISPKEVSTAPSILQTAFIIEHEQGKRFDAKYTLEANLSLAPGAQNRIRECTYYIFDPWKPHLPQGMTPFGPDFGKNLLKLHELTAVSGPS
jgi:hypothetical protein